MYLYNRDNLFDLFPYEIYGMSPKIEKNSTFELNRIPKNSCVQHNHRIENDKGNFLPNPNPGSPPSKTIP